MNTDLKTMLLAVEAIHATGKPSAMPTHIEIAEAFGLTERALLHALNGAKLLGLPNLGTNTAPYRGINLSGAGFNRTISFPDRNQNEGPWTLVLNATGRIVIAHAERLAGDDLVRAQAAGDWFTFVEDTVPANVQAYLNGRGLHELMAVLPRSLNIHLDLARAGAVEATTAVGNAKAFVTGLEDGGRK